MGRVISLLLAVLLVSGCVASSMVPPKEEIAKLERAQIVALKPPPLAAPANLYFAIINHAESVPAFPMGVRIDLEDDDPDTKLIQASLENKAAWLPTVVLADEAQRQLSARGVPSAVSRNIKPIPGLIPRRVIPDLQYWLAPIRNWYDNADPVSEYREKGFEPRSYVLEIGILNYELVRSAVVLQVLIKMIDPSSGKLLGRARAYSLIPLPALDNAFANDGAVYKSAIAATGRNLVRQCLSDLGLV